MDGSLWREKSLRAILSRESIKWRRRGKRKNEVFAYPDCERDT